MALICKGVDEELNEAWVILLKGERKKHTEADLYSDERNENLRLAGRKL